MDNNSKIVIWNKLLGNVSTKVPALDLDYTKNGVRAPKFFAKVDPNFEQGVIKLDEIPSGQYILDFANKKFGGGVLGRGWVQEEQLVFCSSLMANNAQGVTNVQIFAKNLQDNPAIIQCEAVLKIDSPTPGDPLHPYMAGRAGWTACENNLERAFHVVTPRQANLLAAAAPDLNVAVTRCKRPATKDDYAVWFDTCTKAFGLLPAGAVVHTGLWGAGYFGHSPVASLLLQLRAAGKMENPPKLVFHIPTQGELEKLERELKSYWPDLQKQPAPVFNQTLAKMTNVTAGHVTPSSSQQNCGYAEIYKTIGGVKRVFMLWREEGGGKYKYVLPGGIYPGGFVTGFIPLLERQLATTKIPSFGNPLRYVTKNSCRHYKAILEDNSKDFFSGGIQQLEKLRLKYTKIDNVKYKWVRVNDFNSHSKDNYSFTYQTGGGDENLGEIGDGEIGDGEIGDGEIAIQLEDSTRAYLGLERCDGTDADACAPCDDDDHGEEMIPQEGGAPERDGFLGLIAGLGVTTACAFLLSLTQ